MCSVGVCVHILPTTSIHALLVSLNVIFHGERGIWIPLCTCIDKKMFLSVVLFHLVNKCY